ncbi:MAG: 30S ribosomal protein S9 [bacterium]
MAEPKKKASAPKKKKAEPKKEAKKEIKKAIPAVEDKKMTETVAVAPKIKVITTPKVKMPAQKYFGTGRRKEAVAKVWIAPGSGKILVNGKTKEEYFCGRKTIEYQIARPFITTKNEGKYDVWAKVFGGGVPGQAGAVTLGISRALIQFNPDLKPMLKREGLLTRDPRMKERKKYGLKRARKAFQFSKR